MLRSRSRLLGNLGLVLILGLFLGFLFPNNDVHVHLPMVSRYQAPRNLLLSISNQHRHGRIAVSEPILVNISQTPDFDGLEMDMHNIHRRVILDDSYDEADGVVKFHAWHWGHKSNHYYAFDDDITRNTYFNYPAEQDEQGHLSPLFHERHCRRVAWHRDLHINCNNFHEFDRSNQLLTHQISFLGKGTYRETFKASDPLGTGFVYKTLKYGRINDGDDDNSYSHKDLEYMRLDALVPDIFTSNRYFVDIYGFCGGSHFSELMPWGDLDGIPQVYGKFHRDVVYEQKLAHSESVALHMNDDLTPSNKLQIALEMATALAYMHNYAGGVIVHDDIWLAQFLPVQDWSKGVPMDADQYIKMNDWNRAEIMLYDEENHEYCDYINGQRVDDVRMELRDRSERSSFCASYGCFGGARRCAAARKVPLSKALRRTCVIFVTFPSPSCSHSHQLSHSTRRCSADHPKNTATSRVTIASTFSRWASTSITSLQVWAFSLIRPKTQKTLSSSF